MTLRHVFGVRHLPEHEASPSTSTGLGQSSIRSSSTRSSPKIEGRPRLAQHFSSISGDTDGDLSSIRLDLEATWTPVIARISTHTIRLEREYNYNRAIIQTSDPECKHTVRPIELVPLASTPGDSHPVLVSIFEAPGPNYLRELITFGPAFYGSRTRSSSNKNSPGEQVPLTLFLDFAIGACECLELLHYGHKTIHGEIRADAFHFNRETGAVKLANSGNGPKAFENLLSSEGWSTTSREVGVKNKLQFMAPEQTARLTVEPDSRTDIYSFGVLLWAMLMGKPAFDVASPLDIIQRVLSSRLPSVSSERFDIPDVVSNIIDRMTKKQMDERYQSVSGLKHDLTSIQKLLGEGDNEGVKTFQIGTRDVSSFFTLPSKTFGREIETKKILKLIERSHKKLQSVTGKAKAQATYSISSNSSVSDSRGDSFDIVDGSSDSGSQVFPDSRSNSNAGLNPEGLTIQSRSVALSDRESYASSQTNGTGHQTGDVLTPLAKRRGSHKFRKRGRCDVITLLGPQGIGKTHLIQHIQPSIRRHGYFAWARFDQARTEPFGPLLKAMSSLFRQIFSEKDVTTSYHNQIRTNLRGIWPTLQPMLDLPENLLVHAGPTSVPRSHPVPQKSSESELSRVNSITSSFSSASRHPGQDFLRGPPNTKTLRFINSFLDVLRTMANGKLICIALDDVQACDEESLELICNIISARTPVVLMLSARQETGASRPTSVSKILKLDSANLIELSSLIEDEVFEFCGMTMHREVSDVIPLAAVVHQKSAGNPFLMREILQTCYAKNCIWYDWRSSSWLFDLDRVFTEFTSDDGGCLTNKFITRRLEEMSPAARSILAWASILGSSFSFALIKKLLSGEMLYTSGHEQADDVTCPMRAKLARQSEHDIIDGLQSLLFSNILVPGESDDEFRFSHNRYARAATSMRECVQVAKMHFVVVETVMKYFRADDKKTLYFLARHICFAADIIRKRVRHRIRHRDILFKAAQTAAQEAARPTALWYYKTCLQLLQDDHWNDQVPDVHYDETSTIFIQSAEMLYLQGEGTEALTLLSETFAHARTVSDKTRGWLLWSRIFASRGDLGAAMKALKTSLSELGIPVPETSWDDCDIQFRKLESRLRPLEESQILSSPISRDANVIAAGNVLVEAISSAFWVDSLLYYQLGITFVSMMLEKGYCIQAGLGYCHLGTIAIARFKDTGFGIRLGRIGKWFLEAKDDAWSRGRGYAVHALFLGHFETPLRQLLPSLEDALDFSYSSGDRTISLLSTGLMAAYRMFCGQDVAELELFCRYAPEEFDRWEDDIRGGTIIIIVKQVTRALQGKTDFTSADNVLCDAGHNTKQYLARVASLATATQRPIDLYWSYAILPLYVYGHYEKAIEVGSRLTETMRNLWSMRPAAHLVFYLALSMLARCKIEHSPEKRDETLATVDSFKQQLDFWGSFNNVNYAMWSFLLSAEITNAREQYGDSVRYYEMAVDHCQVHGFALEEALAMELQAEFLISQGAKRAGKAMMQESIAAWNRINAVGKASQLSEKHEYLLKTAVTSRTMDVAVQTEESPFMAVRHSGDQVDHSKNDWTTAWVEPRTKADQATPLELPGLGLGKSHKIIRGTLLTDSRYT